MPPIRRPADDHFDDFEPIEPAAKPPADPLDDFELIDPIAAPAPRRPRPAPVRRPMPAADFDDFEPEKSRMGLYIGLGVGGLVLLVGAVAAVLFLDDSGQNPPATTMSMMKKDEFPGLRPPMQTWSKKSTFEPKPEMPTQKFDPGIKPPESPKFDPNMKAPPESPKNEPVVKAVPRLRETPTSFRMRPGSNMGARILWTQVPESKVRYEIRKAPPGVTVDSGGSVDWKIPENVERIEHEIVVAISVEDPKTELLWVRKFDLRGAAPVVAANPNLPKDLPPGSPPAFLEVALDQLPAYDGGPIETIDPKLTKGDELSFATVGAGGRYLFVATTAAPEIRMYDLSTRKAMKPIPYKAGGTPSVRLAGGANVLVAYEPNSATLTSWRLDALDSPKELRLPTPGGHQMLLGAESNGPLIVANGSGQLPLCWIVDPVALVPVRYDFGSDDQKAEFQRCRPSGIDPAGTTLVSNAVVDRRVVTAARKIGPDSIRLVESPSHATADPFAGVSAGGERVLTRQGETEVSTGTLKNKLVRPAPASTRSVYSVDSADQKIAFAVQSRPSRSVPELELWQSGGGAPLARLEDDEAAMTAIGKDPGLLPPSPNFDRMFCVAAWNVVVIRDSSRIWIWRATVAESKAPEMTTPAPKMGPKTDPKMEPKAEAKVEPKAEARNEGDVRVLARQDRPIRMTSAGMYSYQIRLVPKPEFPVQYEVKKGPQGLKVDEFGKVSWTIPHSTDPAEHEVVIRVFNEDKKLELTDTCRFLIQAMPPKP